MDFRESPSGFAVFCNGLISKHTEVHLRVVLPKGKVSKNVQPALTAGECRLPSKQVV